MLTKGQRNRTMGGAPAKSYIRSDPKLGCPTVGGMIEEKRAIFAIPIAKGWVKGRG